MSVKIVLSKEQASLLNMGTKVMTGPPESKAYYFLPFWFEQHPEFPNWFNMHSLEKLPKELKDYLNEERGQKTVEDDGTK